MAAVGERVDGERPLAIAHARLQGDLDIAAAMLRRAYRLGEEPVSPRPVVVERIA